MPHSFTSGQILRETLHLLRQRPGLSLAALALLAAVGLPIDLGGYTEDQARLATFAVNLLTLGFNYAIIRALLDALGGSPPGRGGVPAFIGLGIVSSLGIVLGMVLLLIPGIILIVRWSASTAILLDEPVGVVDALQESWSRTRGHGWGIAIALLAVWVPPIAVVAGAFVLDTLLGFTLYSAIALNVLLPVAQILGWHVGVAIHRLTSGGNELAEVFA